MYNVHSYKKPIAYSELSIWELVPSLYHIHIFVNLKHTSHPTPHLPHHSALVPPTPPSFFPLVSFFLHLFRVASSQSLYDQVDMSLLIEARESRIPNQKDA